MIRNISYIIKRIVIGVGIALVLTFLRRGFVLNVQAMEVDGYPIGEDVSIINNTTSSYTKTINGSPWSSLAGSYGYINGTFSISKVDGSATSINVTPKQVYVNSGNTSWVCSIGSNNLTNSTFNQATYSYKCPIQMTSSGLSSLVIQFVDIQTNFPSMYRLVIGSLVSFEIHNDSNINIDTSGTTNAINNQITNDNQNTQNIINNQNQNSQDTQNVIKEQFENCLSYDLNRSNLSSFISNKYLNQNGNEISSSNVGISNYIRVSSNENYNFSLNTSLSASSYCLYDTNKSLLSCSVYSGNTSFVITPNQNGYVRFTFSTLSSSNFSFTGKSCTNRLDEQTQATQDINNTINNDNVDGANSKATSFFDNFQSNSHGLTGIITAPLRLVNSLASSSCSPLVLPLPFVNQNATLPCMSSVYSRFPTFLNLYQLITTGIIAYWVLIKIFGHVKGMQNPNDDKIEVFDL